VQRYNIGKFSSRRSAALGGFVLVLMALVEFLPNTQAFAWRTRRMFLSDWSEFESLKEKASLSRAAKVLLTYLSRMRTI
jgi:hypothetical protein